MTKRWKRIKITLAVLLGVIACSTLAPAPLFAYYYRPEMKDFFVLTRDWRWWMPHPSLNEADKMQLDETLEPDRVRPE